MKQEYNLDLECITKILKYTKAISDAYTMFEITNVEGLKRNHVCQLAVTQAITNIHEIKKRMSQDVLVQMPLFGKIGLKAVRNIASHDYDSLDFGIIFRRTRQLLASEVNKELEEAKNGIERSQADDS